MILFTFLLFLSGYVLQQQTVRGLQEAIRPRIPAPPTSQTAEVPLAEQIQASRLFGGSPGSKGRIAYQKFLRTEETTSRVDWKRLAHVQLVRSHHDVCNAIMLLGELAALRSPARRILLFPTVWANEKASGRGDVADPFLDTTRRLMRMAARRFGVELRPVDPMVAGLTEEGDVYSLASTFALTDLDRVLSIETPGILLDASPLDAVLAFTESAPFAMLHDSTEGDGVHADDLYLVQPSEIKHLELVRRIPALQNYNDSLLATAFEDPLLLASSTDNGALVRSIGALHEVGTEFNATAFLSGAAYIRFSDPKLPGPEWDVPYAQRREARPMNQDADWTWTKLYGEFAQKRTDICGLDLEAWRS